MSRKLLAHLSVWGCCLLALITAPAAAAQGAYGRAGRWITDDQGRVAILNGWNLVNKRAPYTLEATGFDADDADFMRAQGFNTVRLGVTWGAIEPKPGHYDEAYLDSIERTYDLLASRGIAVLLNFHQDMYSEQFQGQGFPSWTVLGDAKWLPRTHMGFPFNYAFSYGLQRAYDHFWNNERGPDGRRLQDAYAQAWAHVAARFRGKPELLGYHLMNEPFAGTAAYVCFKKMSGCPNWDRTRLARFHATVIKAIRAVDPAGIVWYSPMLTFNFGVTTSHPATGDARAGFAFNTYCQNTGENLALGLLMYYNLRRSCSQMADLVLDHANGQAARNDETVLMTEWAGADDMELFEATARSAERHMISWQEWAYWSADPSRDRPKDGLIRDITKPPAGDNVKTDRLAVSARIHPASVSGTPTAYRFTPSTKRFDFTFSTLRPGQSSARFADGSETTVAVPEFVFPGDYAVSARGARVTSAPGARTLTLASCPGATEVLVRVGPGTTAQAARTC
ncbi:MAG: cellulase family glycosylhydrolase [Solirubrobacteraceae bacterium]|nr:cellulase family glycosylhydrolase [Solirubrobacteraceae bacterium]